MPTDTDPAGLNDRLDEESSSIEEMAREKLGLRSWDCPALYRETADAATDTDLPFWTVLLLSGAIATLGLALDATAVVIGAMLVAPLLGPLLGLSLALAVGDGRLALQTGLTILLGAAGVIALAAVLTLALPFQAVTSEILARTRPTTLDLAIAVFSGLAGAVVTVSRENRLSASIPGVAIAVALIPPLGVAGFGLATGDGGYVRGSLLLFGANLGGIVLSGMGAFLLVGMHRDDVVEAARRWHETADLPGLAGRISRAKSLRRVRVLTSPRARVALVLAFVAAVAVPLTVSLQQVLRETRIERAASALEARLEADGLASVLSRDVTIGKSTARIRIRAATTDWIDDTERRAAEAAAAEAAGEPVSLVLEQMIASSGDLEAFAAMLPSQTEEIAPDVAPVPEAPQATVTRLRGEVSSVLGRLALPDSVAIVSAAVGIGPGPASLRLAYAAPRALSPDAEAIVRRQLASALQADPSTVVATLVSTAPRPLSTPPASLAGLLDRYPTLGLEVTADSAAAATARQRLVEAGAPPSRITLRRGTPASVQVRLRSSES